MGFKVLGIGMEGSRLTDREHWESVLNPSLTRSSPRGLPIFDEIAPHMPKERGLRFFEVGCAPGGILAQFCGHFGWEANGIDYVEGLEEVREYLRGLGIAVGTIHKADFASWRSPDRYDVVASFGFLEHFRRAEEVADQHFNLTRPGGWVVISLPNFARGQRILHWILDRDNLKRHNTRCMSRAFLRELGKRNRAKTVFIGYAGGPFDFWTGSHPRTLPGRVMTRNLQRLGRVAKRLAPTSTNSLFSPYIFAVYQKAQESVENGVGRDDH